MQGGPSMLPAHCKFVWAVTLTVKHWAASFRLGLMSLLAIALMLTVENAPVSAQYSAQYCDDETIVKCYYSSSALDLHLDGHGKAMRFFVPNGQEPRTYFNDSGMLYTNGWMVLSGVYSGSGDGYNIAPPSSDPSMLGIWSDVGGPALQVRAANAPGTYLLGGLNRYGQYTFSIEENGALQWGASTRGGMDTKLYRASAATLRTSGNFTVDGNLNTRTLLVNGNFTATGLKSATVETSSYGKRKLYAMESPENWFEDFGSAKLMNGQIVVALDPIFVDTVNTAEPYHVFLTPNGDCTLYTTQKNSLSFKVSSHDGESNCEFDYRIIAKRKGYENVRLETVADVEQETQVTEK